MNNNNNLAIKATELCARLGICRSTLDSLIKKGVLTPIKHLRRNRLFAMTQVEEFLSGKR